MSPSQTEIAAACAVVDSAGMVMVREQETGDREGVTRSHEPGDDQSPSSPYNGVSPHKSKKTIGLSLSSHNFTRVLYFCLILAGNSV